MSFRIRIHNQNNGSLQFINDSKKFKEKLNILSLLLIYYLFDNIPYSILLIGNKNIHKDPDPAGSDIIWPPGSWFWSVNQDYGSLESDPESKEIFMDPQHWFFG